MTPSHKARNPMMFLIGGGLVMMVAVVAVVLFFDGRSTAKRAELMAPAAEAAGLSFAARPGSSPATALPSFPLLSRGSERSAENLMTGTSGGIPVQVFDYHFLDGTGNQRDRYAQTVLYLDTAGRLRVPDFAANGQTTATRIAGRLGHGPETIALSSAPDFSKTHLLTGSDPAAIQSTFDSRLVAFFSQRSDISVEAASGGLLVYRYQKLASPQELPGLLTDGIALVEALR